MSIVEGQGVTMVRQHVQNATDEELGARVRAMVEKGVVMFAVVDQPDWMKRDHFLPVGQVEDYLTHEIHDA